MGKERINDYIRNSEDRLLKAIRVDTNVSEGTELVSLKRGSNKRSNRDGIKIVAWSV